MRNQAFTEALSRTLQAGFDITVETDVRTGHTMFITPVPGADNEVRTYTHTSPVTGNALLRRLECDLLIAPGYGQPYAVRYKGHAYESSITFLTPNQVVPLPVPAPKEPETDWANTLTDTLVEHFPTKTRYYFSHAALSGRLVLFADGRTSRTATRKFTLHPDSVRIVKED